VAPDHGSFIGHALVTELAVPGEKIAQRCRPCRIPLTKADCDAKLTLASRTPACRRSTRSKRSQQVTGLRMRDVEHGAIAALMACPPAGLVLRWVPPRLPME
jgi:hypothetical protein